MFSQDRSLQELAMTYKILTVDDSRTIRMIVKKAFQSFNCELFEAENGMEGLALAAKIIPDLIVLDITMPVMTGVEMLSKLKENADLKAIPVIMLTAESGKDNVMNIVKMGVRDYIVKPFKGDQLIERARHIIDLKLGAQPKPASDGPRALDCLGVDGDFLILSLPAKITHALGAQIDSAAK
jgi:DNA-binding response OmpR family regulator